MCAGSGSDSGREQWRWQQIVCKGRHRARQSAQVVDRACAMQHTFTNLGAKVAWAKVLCETLIQCRQIGALRKTTYEVADAQLLVEQRDVDAINLQGWFGAFEHAHVPLPFVIGHPDPDLGVDDFQTMAIEHGVLPQTKFADRHEPLTVKRNATTQTSDRDTDQKLAGRHGAVSLLGAKV